MTGRHAHKGHDAIHTRLMLVPGMQMRYANVIPHPVAMPCLRDAQAHHVSHAVNNLYQCSVC